MKNNRTSKVSSKTSRVYTEADERTFEMSVITYRDESDSDPNTTWVALALEMNVRGHGATPSKAMEDLLEMLEAQITFAMERGHPESVWHPAEPKYFEMFEEARRQQSLSRLGGPKRHEKGPRAEMIPLPPLTRAAWGGACA